jgi:hypothetical protein
MARSRQSGEVLRWRVILGYVCLITLVGCILPALLPGRDGGDPPPGGAADTVLAVLFWLDAFLLPPGTPDAVRLPANIFTCALWGAAIGVAHCLVFRRGEVPAASRGEHRGGAA